MLTAIIGSACFVLIGIILATIRVVKLIRQERSLMNKIWASWQMEKANPHVIREDAEKALKCDDHNA